MNYSTAELDQTDEDFFCEVSDETLEAAAGTPIGGQAMVTVGPTIMIGGAADLGSSRRSLRDRRAPPPALGCTSSPATRPGASPPMWPSLAVPSAPA